MKPAPKQPRSMLDRWKKLVEYPAKSDEKCLGKLELLHEESEYQKSTAAYFHQHIANECSYGVLNWVSSVASRRIGLTNKPILISLLIMQFITL